MRHHWPTSHGVTISGLTSVLFIATRHPRSRLGLWLVVSAVLVLAIACGDEETTTNSEAPDPVNATFVIQGKEVTLKDAQAEQTIVPGSASKIITRLIDKEATADLDGDGKLDRVVALSQETGGSGTFYYVAVLLNDETASGKAIPAQLLGDRIIINDISVSAEVIAVALLTRSESEPFASPPTVAITEKFRLQDNELVNTP